MNTNKQSPAERLSFWSNHIEQWRQSSLSRTAYCEQAGINLHQLSYWIKKAEGKTAYKPKPNFIPVTEQTSVVSASTYGFKFILASGASLHWCGQADPNYLQKLVMVLGQ